MTRHFIRRKNRTIVRFIVVNTTAFLITGCGTVAPLGSALEPHGTAGPSMCENFGPETRCSRSDFSRITRELDRINRSAKLGFRGW